MGKNKAKPWVCDWCETRFRTPVHLSRHEKKDHSWELREEAAELAKQAEPAPAIGRSIIRAATREIIKIKVKACAALQDEVIFQLQQELEDQLEQEATALKKAGHSASSVVVHGKMDHPAYQCAICSMVFATEYGLRNHTASKLSHLIKLCPLCQTFRGFAENDILMHLTSWRCQATEGMSKQQVHWMLEAREPHTALCFKVHIWANNPSAAKSVSSPVTEQPQKAHVDATEPRSSSNGGAHNLKYQCPFCEEAFIIPAFLISHLTGPTHPEQTFYCNKPNCPGVFTDAVAFFAHTASCSGRPKPPRVPVMPSQTPTPASSAMQSIVPVVPAQLMNQNTVTMNFAQTSGAVTYRKPGPSRAVPIRHPAENTSEQLPKTETAIASANGNATAASERQPTLYYRWTAEPRVEPATTSAINKEPVTNIAAAGSQQPVASTGHIMASTGTAATENLSVTTDIHNPIPDAMVKDRAIQSGHESDPNQEIERCIHEDAFDDDLIDLKAQTDSSNGAESACMLDSNRPATPSVPPHLRHKVKAIYAGHVRPAQAVPTEPDACLPGDEHEGTQDKPPAHDDPFHRMWQRELEKKTREGQEREARAAEEALLKARAKESALLNSNIDKIKALAVRKRPADQPEQSTVLPIPGNANGTAAPPHAATSISIGNTTDETADQVAQPQSSTEAQDEPSPTRRQGLPRPMAAHSSPRSAVSVGFSEHEMVVKKHLMEQKRELSMQRTDQELSKDPSADEAAKEACATGSTWW